MPSRWGIPSAGVHRNGCWTPPEFLGRGCGTDNNNKKRANLKGQVYGSGARSSIFYGSVTRHLLVDVELKFERADM